MLNLGAGLESRGVVVTGAAGGIGRATAELFARCGARVMAVDLDKAAVEDVIAGLPGSGHVAFACDLSDLSSHRRITSKAVETLGSVSALAHLAAVLRRRSAMTDVTEEDWDAQLDVNLKATFFLCREVAEVMKTNGGGSIVAVASQGWWTGGFGGSVVYSASKSGVVTLTRGLARTYGPSGVRINAVAPGQIATPMLFTDLDDAVRERMVADTPLGRIGDPAEVASVVVFLASQNASFITGATVNVSGGFLMY